jgi:hypothetical protein
VLAIALIGEGILLAAQNLLLARRLARRIEHDQARLPARYRRSLASNLAVPVLSICLGTEFFAVLGLFRSAALSVAVLVLSNVVSMAAILVSLFASREYS